MNDPHLTRLFLFIGILFALTAGGIWVLFLRPVPTKSATGTIINKTFKPAGTYWQYPPGLNRGFRTGTPIPIAEAFVFEIKAEAFEDPIFYSLNTVASQAFDVGNRVRVFYTQRSIPFIWRRVYVMDMTITDSPVQTSATKTT